LSSTLVRQDRSGCFRLMSARLRFFLHRSAFGTFAINLLTDPQTVLEPGTLALLALGLLDLGVTRRRSAA